jgi:hypothetical protein
VLRELKLLRLSQFTKFRLDLRNERDGSLEGAVARNIDDFLRFFIPEAESIFDFNRPLNFLDKG